MAIVRIKLRDLEKGRVELPTDEENLVIVSRASAFRVEAADVHFNSDSAVFLPDAGAAKPTGAVNPNITGIGVLAACLQYAQSHPERRALVAGHTDSVGSPGYNLTLSSLRATNTKAALTGDRDGWVQTALAKSCVADQQRLLQFFAFAFHWDCDPGGVDNMAGAQTRTAVRAFQTRYNAKFDASIATDGAVGKETWGAFFDASRLELAAQLALDDEGLSALQQGITFADPGHAAVGCGDSHPIEAAGASQFRSATNRRVEILFFDPGDLPTFPCHPSPSTCRPAECPIYRLKHFAFDPVPIDQDVVVRVQIIDGDGTPAPGVACSVTDGGTAEGGATDGDGFIGVRPDADAESIEIEWTPEGEPPVPLRRRIFLNLASGDESGRRRLSNLGYVAATLEEAVEQFQFAFNRNPTGRLADVQDDIVAWHDDGILPERGTAPAPLASNDPFPGDEVTSVNLSDGPGQSVVV